MTLVNAGLDAMACALGGDIAGFTGSTTSAPTGTGIVDTGASWTSSAYIGHIVVMGAVYGVITANTGTALTIDRWYNPALPGGTVGSTPSTGVFTILPGNAPYMYMGLGTGSSVSVSDTSLTTEYTTSGGGLLRQIATYAHTTGASSYSLAATYVVNSSDLSNLPYTIGKIGIFNTLTNSTGRMMFETVLSPTATVSASGDSVTLTDTITI